MTDAELLEVANWISEKHSLMSSGESYRISAVADRLLELLPPTDDAEPVTERWLREIGFEMEDTFPTARSVENGLRATTSGRWLLEDTDHEVAYVPAPKTRGECRRLCAALGIELKGSAS